jgi:hypothetical protein
MAELTDRDVDLYITHMVGNAEVRRARAGRFAAEAILHDHKISKLDLAAFVRAREALRIWTHLREGIRDGGNPRMALERMRSSLANGRRNAYAVPMGPGLAAWQEHYVLRERQRVAELMADEKIVEFLSTVTDGEEGWQ